MSGRIGGLSSMASYLTLRRTPCHYDKTRNRGVGFVACRSIFEQNDIQASIFKHRANICGAVGETQLLTENNTIAAMGFDREGEQAAWRQCPRACSDNGHKVREIDKYVGCKDEIVRRSGSFVREKRRDIADREAVVDFPDSRQSHHVR